MQFFQLILNYRQGAYHLQALSEAYDDSYEVFVGSVKVHEDVITFAPAPGLIMSETVRMAFDVMVINLVLDNESARKEVPALEYVGKLDRSTLSPLHQ